MLGSLFFCSIKEKYGIIILYPYSCKVKIVEVEYTVNKSKTGLPVEMKVSLKREEKLC